jgi:hypothetical protein
MDARPRARCDLTVPSGMPSVPAMARTDHWCP